MKDSYQIKIRFNTKAELAQMQLQVEAFKKQAKLTYKNEAYKALLQKGYESLNQEQQETQVTLLNKRIQLIEAEVRLLLFVVSKQFKLKLSELEAIDINQLPILNSILEVIADEE